MSWYYKRMKKLNPKKIVIGIGLGLLVVQVFWFIGVQAYANRTLIKTTATVVRVERQYSGCAVSQKFCDRSDRLFPIYEYFDQSGKRYLQDDRFFGEYKQNNPLRKIFGKEVGDTVTAYYTNDNPKDVIFMASLTAYTAWLIPLYLSLPFLMVGLVLFLLDKKKDSRKSPS